MTRRERSEVRRWTRRLRSNRLASTVRLRIPVTNLANHVRQLASRSPPLPSLLHRRKDSLSSTQHRQESEEDGTEKGCKILILVDRLEQEGSDCRLESIRSYFIACHSSLGITRLGQVFPRALFAVDFTRRADGALLCVIRYDGRAREQINREQRNRQSSSLPSSRYLPPLRLCITSVCPRARHQSHYTRHQTKERGNQFRIWIRNFLVSLP